MNTKNNQRFQKTEQQIEETFLLLCQSTAPDKITVKQLCQEIGINRSSFYAHYLDIPDLIQKTGIKYISKIRDLFSQNGMIMEHFTSLPLLTQLIEQVYDNRDFFDIYFNHTNTNTLNKHFSLLWDASAKPYLQSFGLTDEKHMQYHFTFFTAGFIAVLSQWLSDGCKEKPEEIAKIILAKQNALTGLTAR
ncbi:MAG: TetR-like C-terminal domain-containing protein [Fusicatenibacter sp.]|nr:TetR-like C-terminal domain-containing protein [Lachnospiraceae bacterium]MDY2938715.1 TetR-like C-terminal domain-containing protein [Fusicatenibacter sp.]